MKALLIDKPVKAEEIFLTECEIPKVKSGWVLVKCRAFGLNHSEKILRHEKILESYIQKPVIPGIECAGEIAGKISADKVLDLIGAKYLPDTLKTVVPSESAFVCNTGILGGIYELKNFDPINNLFSPVSKRILRRTASKLLVEDNFSRIVLPDFLLSQFKPASEISFAR